MALKPTIYKAKIDLSHVDENHYDQFNLTIACHPSETHERMMTRILALCLHAQDGPEFTRGLCVTDEPDIWVKTLDDRIDLWIDVGEPSPERIKKAARTAGNVHVYSFNLKSPPWWKKDRENFLETGALFFRFNWSEIQALAQLVERTMDLSVTISDSTFYVASSKGECEVSLTPLL